MRTTNPALLLVCVTLLTACAKKDEAAPLTTAQNAVAKKSGELAVGDFIASADDKVVRVHSEIAGPLGIVRMEGEDAEKLYESLAVEETTYPENEILEETVARIGENIECYLQTTKATQAVSYSCVYYFDYKTGEAKVRNAAVKIVRDDSIDTSDYASEGLVMNSPQTPSARILVSGENARLIAAGLESEARSLNLDDPANGLKVKHGKNLYCYFDGGLNSCNIDINYRTGAANLNPEHQ